MPNNTVMCKGRQYADATTLASAYSIDVRVIQAAIAKGEYLDNVVDYYSMLNQKSVSYSNSYNSYKGKMPISCFNHLGEQFYSIEDFVNKSGISYYRVYTRRIANWDMGDTWVIPPKNEKTQKVGFTVDYLGNHYATEDLMLAAYNLTRKQFYARRIRGYWYSSCFADISFSNPKLDDYTIKTPPKGVTVAYLSELFKGVYSHFMEYSDGSIKMSTQGILSEEEELKNELGDLYEHYLGECNGDVSKLSKKINDGEVRGLCIL